MHHMYDMIHVLHMCDMTHVPYTMYLRWRDSLICVTWLIDMCAVTHSYVCRDSCTSHDVSEVKYVFCCWQDRYNTAKITRGSYLHVWSLQCCVCHIYMWHDSFIRMTWSMYFICVPWLMYLTRCIWGDMTHWHVWHDSLIYVTWLRWHDSLICVPWLIHMCDMTQVPYTMYLRWHDSLMCAMTHSYVWHDSCTLNDVSEMTYRP